MAMIVDALASQFADTLAALIKEEVTMMVGVKGELRQLEKKLRTIRNLLEDAERRAFTDAAVRSWLADLKDVVYDAVDVIDRCRTHAEQLARLSSDRTVHCYSPLFSCFRRVVFRHQIGSSIRSINERLARVVKDQSDFNLIGIAAAAPNDQGSSRIHRQTDPILEPDIVGTGIENDTSYLVELLTKEHGGPKIQILAIVGMGGIGKTTLAQKIYNHKTIRDNFQMPQPMWVCISQDYDDTNLLTVVVRCIAGGISEGARSFAELQLLLARVIEGKKFFLILDDVWNAQVWENLLRKPLQNGAAGSRVLITTRDERVAKQMGAMHLHIVQPLTAVEGWSLLHKMVFEMTEGGIDVVGDIGMMIVEKCGGHPLAIKTIAGVLKTKDRTRWEWERVLRNPAWSLTDLPNGVMGVLYLSYEDLPFHLKQCFVFCSLFPEDYVFMRHTLIQYWVSEGFVKEESGMISEEVAQGYYKELLRRSLLQADPQYYDYGGCRIHDLLRSLAQYLARDENFVGDVNGLVEVVATASTKLRHIYIVDRNLNAIPEVVKAQTSLRTLLFDSMGVVPQDLFEKLRSLRVLDFSGTDLTRLPESIGNLVHLRYLDLCDCPIEELPESIGSLSNLQCLILQRCVNLWKLPKGVAKLYNLRSLDVHRTPLNGMPMGIGRLRHMNRLIGFVTNESITDSSGGGERQQGHGEWCSLKELGSLSRLRALTIKNVERALIWAKPIGSLFNDKCQLKELELSCKPYRADGPPFGDEEVKKIQELFENEFLPPPTLEKFKIDAFFGLQFPSWMMNRDNVSHLLNLRKFEIVNCRLCAKVPPLGQLPNLDNLHIVGATAIKRIGSEFMEIGGGSNRIPFPKLGKLKLKDMPNLVEWLWDDGAIAMPCLWSLRIINCPNLSLPGGLRHAISLTTLQIECVDSLTTIENLFSVKFLSLSKNRNLARVSNLPALLTMTVEDCPELVHVEGLNSLQNLTLKDLALQSLPEWLLLEEGGKPSFPVLERLHILAEGAHVLSRCIEGGPDWPKIQNYPLVHIQDLYGPEFVLYRRDTFTFHTNLGVRGGRSGDGGGGASVDHQN